MCSLRSARLSEVDVADVFSLGGVAAAVRVYAGPAMRLLDAVCGSRACWAGWLWMWCLPESWVARARIRVRVWVC